MQTRTIHEIRMACTSEAAAEKAAGYDPCVAGDTIHVVLQDGEDHVIIRFEQSEWPLSVARSAAEDGYVTQQEADRVTAAVHAMDRPGLPAPAAASWQEKEQLYLALLDLAPQFDIPCRPGGDLRDISVSRHRNGPSAPWRWAIHRYGAGLVMYAWNGKDWWVVDRPVGLLDHAAWDNPMAALTEAQRIARDDEQRGHTGLDNFTD